MHLSVLCLSFFALACAHIPTPPPANFFAEMLEQQATDWNLGDLEGFCSVYTKDAVFISPSGRTLGRQAILERYQKKYDTPEKRGELTLKIIHEERLGNNTAASIILRWEIAYPEKDNASGWSLIVLNKVKGQWMIIKDASM